MVEYIQIITTTEKKEDAERIAKVLLEKRLAGCVQIMGPIVSTYWWEENIAKTEEWLCLVKSKKDLYGELEKSIRKIHPYRTPEIIALPIIAGNKDYIEWLSVNLNK